MPTTQPKTLTFLGCGSYFSKYGNNNMILDIDGHKLLIDCGFNIREAIEASKFSVTGLDAVFISHQHGDHMYGLEYLALVSMYVIQGRRLTLFLPKSLMPAVEALLDALTYSNEADYTLADYFDIVLVNDHFTFAGTDIAIHAMPHIRTPTGREMMSYGLEIETAKGGAFITTDFAMEKCTAAERVAVMEVFERCAIILHDTETTERASSVHTHIRTIAEYPESIRSKLLMMHYSDIDMMKQVMPGGRWVIVGEPIPLD